MNVYSIFYFFILISLSIIECQREGPAGAKHQDPIADGPHGVISPEEFTRGIQSKIDKQNQEEEAHKQNRFLHCFNLIADSIKKYDQVVKCYLSLDETYEGVVDCCHDHFDKLNKEFNQLGYELKKQEASIFTMIVNEEGTRRYYKMEIKTK